MNYTNLTLLGLGLLGILLHNLVEMNKINKTTEGKLSIRKYISLEVYSILISIIVVVVALMIKSEITQLEQVGTWLGLSFVSIGYMGQSLIIKVMGKADKITGS